jgi:hypothetical protein
MKIPLISGGVSAFQEAQREQVNNKMRRDRCFMEEISQLIHERYLVSRYRAWIDTIFFGGLKGIWSHSVNYEFYTNISEE